MTQQEFEERMGKSVNGATFEEANNVYMETEMSKDEFCFAWKSLGGHGHALVADLMKRIGACDFQIQNLTESNKHLLNTLKQGVDFLFEQTQNTGASELRKKTIELIGEKEYIKRMLDGGHELWKADIECIKKLLEQ